jgi:hypothetical protein
MSMHGWEKHCNSYHLVNKYLLSIKKIKKTVALVVKNSTQKIQSWH